MEQVRVIVSVPVPDLGDIAWSCPIADGELMDLGSYTHNVMHVIAAELGGEPTLVHARTGHLEGTDERVDAWAVVDYDLPGGALGLTENNLIGHLDFTITVVGSKGTLHHAQLTYVHTDDRLLLLRGGEEKLVEKLGRASTFTPPAPRLPGRHPLRNAVHTGTADALANTRAIYAAYESAGLPPRPSVDPAG